MSASASIAEVHQSFVACRESAVAWVLCACWWVGSSFREQQDWTTKAKLADGKVARVCVIHRSTGGCEAVAVVNALEHCWLGGLP